MGWIGSSTTSLSDSRLSSASDSEPSVGLGCAVCCVCSAYSACPLVAVTRAFLWAYTSCCAMMSAAEVVRPLDLCWAWHFGIGNLVRALYPFGG